MKNKKEISEERIRLLETAVGDISDRFVREAHEAHSPEKKTKTKILTAPAWLRPVAACLAVLLLGGLVVFSIPVVNNIISRRAPAELPGTDVAEADTKEEETEKKEETEKPVETEVPVETEAPVVTEEIEVSQFDKKHIIAFLLRKDEKQDEFYFGKGVASFNDLLSSPYKKAVATAADAEKVTIDMSPDEIISTLGCPPIHEDAESWDYALDDGRVMRIYKERIRSFDDMLKMIDMWDYENDKAMFPQGDQTTAAKEIEDKIFELRRSRPIIRIEFCEAAEEEEWEYMVDTAIEVTSHDWFEKGIVLDWVTEISKSDYNAIKFPGDTSGTLG